MGSLVIEALEIRISDLVGAGHDAPARPGGPGGDGHGRREHLRSGQDLRLRFELRLLERQISREILREK